MVYMKSNQVKNIVAVTALYPSAMNPERGTFVRQILESIACKGVFVNALVPTSFHHKVKDWYSQKQVAYPYKDQVNVSRPTYFSIPPSLLPRTIGYRIAFKSYRLSVTKYLKSHVEKIDFVYAHFFFSGYACLPICKLLGIPLIVALGESNLSFNDEVFGRERVLSALHEFDRIIVVSKKNRDHVLNLDLELNEKVFYLPNGVDLNHFKPRDKQFARTHLGLPSDLKLILFVGHFNERKGSNRVLQAINSLDDVYGAFLGRGKDKPAGSRVLIADVVDQEKLVWWLSAADVFVLPSLAEGMSNAILEAIASGLPVVVANKDFNHEFLDESCAIFVNPMSVENIAEGIKTILDNPQRMKAMQISGRKCAHSYSLVKRTEKILEYGFGIKADNA
jgi:teichuronic acid biosynthesis glycosyltransferase TuaC